jgi:elongation factor Ts
MSISAQDVNKLRQMTGAGMMDCKKALTEANGDFEKAIEILRKKGQKVSASRSDRDAKEGSVFIKTSSDNKEAVLIALNCETDFVAKNEEFKKLAYEIAMHIAATSPEYKTTTDISPEAKKKAEEVFAEEVEGKPADLREKILSGKLDAYFKDKVLLEQAYIKDPEKSIKNLVEEAVLKFGERVEIGRFSRFSVQ